MVRFHQMNKHIMHPRRQTNQMVKLPISWLRFSSQPIKFQKLSRNPQFCKWSIIYLYRNNHSWVMKINLSRNRGYVLNEISDSNNISHTPDCSNIHSVFSKGTIRMNHKNINILANASILHYSANYFSLIKAWMVAEEGGRNIYVICIFSSFFNF